MSCELNYCYHIYIFPEENIDLLSEFKFKKNTDFKTDRLHYGQEKQAKIYNKEIKSSSYTLANKFLSNSKYTKSKRNYKVDLIFFETF